MAIEKVKDKDYFSHIRQEIIAEVPEGAERILDIGCGLGLTGKAMKQTKKAKEVVGIECVPAIAQEAEVNLDRVICGDVEVLELDYPPEYFDVMIMGDVLEHLRDPWATLARLISYLGRQGFLIITFPNISYWRIAWNLVFHDRFHYESWGILDSTHLRFFTRKSLTQYLEELNFQVLKAAPAQPIRRKSRAFNWISFRKFEHILVFQYVLVAQKK
jgi:2-polyprenyl-3-methyl-5-hydroxy-6-metoxy-1,4-benzoquinol methylase